MSPKLSKSDAIARLCREHPAIEIESKATHFAKINAAKDVWWYDISLKKVSAGHYEFSSRIGIRPPHQSIVSPRRTNQVSSR